MPNFWKSSAWVCNKAEISPTSIESIILIHISRLSRDSHQSSFYCHSPVQLHERMVQARFFVPIKGTFSHRRSVATNWCLSEMSV